jgi:CRISPR-associated protein Cas2
MRYEQLRVMCMFDLPMDTPKDQKAYRIFRKELIVNGFQMLQYSVYYRVVPDRQAAKKYEGILKKLTPPHGEVRLLYISEKQFDDMQLLVGSRSHQEEVVGSQKLVVI